MSLKDALKKCAKNYKFDAAENLSKEIACFKLNYDAPNIGIPKFYRKPPGENDVLQRKLREIACSNFLQRKSETFFNNNELKDLWNLLMKHQTISTKDDGWINYRDFVKIGRLSGEKFKSYFVASVFAKLQQVGESEPGKINTTALFNYIMRKTWLYQTRISLTMYDCAGDGCIDQEGLEKYISELMVTLPQLDGLEASFYTFYVCTAVRKFMFFLDTMKMGRVRILDILACGFLDDLSELRDEDVPKESQASNWFSASSALRVYGDYLNLDKDHNGMLSKEELLSYGTGTLTETFVRRVFQECTTFEGQMDYKAYLDFVLALENRREPQSLRYFFNILDVNGNGYLDTFSLYYFFKAIQDLMESHGQEPIPFKNVQDEIFDMVKPRMPDRIALKDLINCEQGDTVVSILIDLNGFWSHENREIMAAEASNDSKK